MVSPQDQARKFTFQFKDKKVVFAKAAQESEFHVYGKVLVYALYRKEYPTIKVEPKVDERFQPDLSAISYDGTVVFWAECGNVSMDKIVKLFKKFRQAHYVFVKLAKDLPLFEKQLEKNAGDMLSLPLVEIITYPEHFHEWNVSETGDVFIRREDVDIRVWHDPGKKKKYF